MYLIDTNVIGELRKRDNANRGVAAFFGEMKGANTLCYLSVVTVGELRRGIEIIRHRGDSKQADAMTSEFKVDTHHSGELNVVPKTAGLRMGVQIKALTTSHLTATD